MKTIFTTIFLLIFIVNISVAQDKEDQTFVVSGKVINSETKEGISFAHVNLDGTYWSVICDSLGFFRIRVNPDQKLKVRAMGFKPQIVDVQAPSVEAEIFQEIIMEQESYMLRQVDVYSFGTWNDFKEQFVKKKLPEEENIASGFDFGNLNLDLAEANTLKRGGFGLSFGAFGGKKKAKGMEVPTSIQVLHDQLLAEKYNRKIVSEITSEKGKRLDILMKYINSRVRFSHQTSDIYITTKIKQLYKDFLNEDPDSSYNFTYTDTLGKIQNHLRP